jgi:hypothetical protein
MSDSLTTLTTKLQALLMDGGTLFTSTTCTAAIRQALGQLNIRMPIHAGTLIDTVADQYEYELTTALAGATPLTVTDVLLADPSGGEYDVPLTFEHFIEDERWFIRLETPQAAGGSLIVRFSQAHTINGLDSATESTLTAQADVVLLDGAAAQACTIASAGKVEANNLDPNTAANYGKAAERFTKAFDYGIAALTRRRRIQRSVPDTRAWNDEHRTWPHRLI